MPQASSVYQTVKVIPLSKMLLYSLVFLLPISTGKVCFSDQSFFHGYHVFYHSFWLYLTDFIFGGLMLAWLYDISREISLKQFFQRLYTAISHDILYLSTFIFWLILAVSVIISRETLLSAYGFLRFSEYLLIFVYVRENIIISREKNIFFWLILAISVLEAGLGLAQYLNQGSFGLKYLGESYLAPGMRGIAEFISQGIGSWQGISREMLVMRAYGTLPHPNLLGVFLLTAFVANIWLIYGSKKSISREILLSLSLILLSTGLVLTYSRAVWFGAILALIILFIAGRIVKKRLFTRMQSGQRIIEEPNYYPKNVAVILVVLLFALILYLALFGQQIKDRLQGRGAAVFAEQESFVDRARFASVSRETIRTDPFFGVGLRNFIARMDEFNTGERLRPEQHQPVHNIYLLIAAETGLLGLAAFLFLLFNIAKSGIVRFWRTKADANRGETFILLVIFSGFLFLGLFDHYFISLHPTAMLFWIVAGLVVHRQPQTS